MMGTKATRSVVVVVCALLIGFVYVSYAIMEKSYMNTPIIILPHRTGVTLPTSLQNSIHSHEFITTQTLFNETKLLNNGVSTKSRTIATTPTPIVAPVYDVPSVYNLSFLEPGGKICTNITHTIVLVQSSISHQQNRMMIRKSWGSFAKTQIFAGVALQHEVRIGYIVGHTYAESLNMMIREESRMYNDVIIADLHDSYRNLTLKTLSSLKWVDSYCPSAKYFVKCDDDTLVHVPNVLRFLEVNPINRGIVGARMIRIQVRRTGRWRVDKSLYSPSRYPAYFCGPAYIINTSLLKSLLEASKTTPIIPNEDAYVTGILAKQIGAQAFGGGKGFARTGARPPKPYEIVRPNFFSGTSLTPEYMSCIYKSLISQIVC